MLSITLTGHKLEFNLYGDISKVLVFIVYLKSCGIQTK